MLFPFLYDNLYINVKLPKGTIVFREGDMCEHVAFIVSGVIRVAKIGENGKEVNLYRVCRGESCVFVLIATAFMRFCPLYVPFRINTTKK